MLWSDAALLMLVLGQQQQQQQQTSRAYDGGMRFTAGLPPKTANPKERRSCRLNSTVVGLAINRTANVSTGLLVYCPTQLKPN